MTAKELIEAIAERTGYPKVQVKATVEAEAEVLSEQLSHGDNAITTLGSYQVVQLQAREGKNPRTGAPMHIPARKAVKFKARKTLAELIANQH